MDLAISNLFRSNSSRKELRIAESRSVRRTNSSIFFTVLRINFTLRFASRFRECRRSIIRCKLKSVTVKNLDYG